MANGNESTSKSKRGRRKTVMDECEERKTGRVRGDGIIISWSIGISRREETVMEGKGRRLKIPEVRMEGEMKMMLTVVEKRGGRL